MKLPKRYQDAVYFTRLCERAAMKPHIMAELSVLAKRVFNAGVKSCNIPDYDAGPARRRFEKKAKEYGLTVTFPGLYPECHDSEGRVDLATHI